MMKWVYQCVCVRGESIAERCFNVDMYNIISVWVVKGLLARCSWRFLLDRTDTGFGG